tara:strand:+ start:351 stop:524 length:174 start_codon:yes stop_codon:yes gene_type:complete
MKYLVKTSIYVDDKEIKAGSVIDDNAIPKKSKKWLLEQNIIEKSDGQTKPTKIEEEE